MEKKFVSQDNLNVILTGMKTKVQTMVDESKVTKTSELTNDSTFQTQEQMTTAITAALTDVAIKPEIVSVLPTEDISTKKMYLVLDADASVDSQNVYDEWLYINNKWEKIGSTKVAVDVKDMTAEETTAFIEALWKTEA